MGVVRACHAVVSGRRQVTAVPSFVYIRVHSWLMKMNDDALLFKEEVFQIVGCAIEVLNTLGHGLVEKPYENALVVEFALRKIPFRQQPPFNVLYKGHTIGLFVPDLIAFDSIVVDTKVIERITDHERGLMLNYLRITSLRVDVIFNFKHAKLEWERIVL
jgi:GxxExxY protein